MEKLKNYANYLYRHNLVRYLFVGGTSFVILFGVQVFLHGILDVWLPLATFIAYSTSVIFNFTANRRWTFSASEAKSLKQHILPYAALLSFNLLFNELFINLGTHFINYAVATVLAVLIQTSWTYFIYKNVIFNKKTEAKE